MSGEKNINKQSYASQINDIFKYKKIPLRLPEKMVLKAIAAYADKQGKCSISLDEIASYCSLYKTNVSRYIKTLKAHKILTVKKQFKRGTNCMTNSSYLINIKAIIDLSIDQNGSPVIAGSHQCDVTIEPINEQKDRLGHINMMLGSHQCDGVKTISKSKTTNALKDIVQDKTLDTNKTPHGFDEFWAAYPRKEKKKAAYQIWVRNNLTDQAEKILTDLYDRKARHDRWDDISFIPLPTTYLNNESWEDEIIDKHLSQGNGNVGSKQNGNGSYIDQLKRAVGIAQGDSNVSSIQDYLGGKVDKKY